MRARPALALTVLLAAVATGCAGPASPPPPSAAPTAAAQPTTPSAPTPTPTADVLSDLTPDQRFLLQLFTTPGLYGNEQLTAIPKSDLLASGRFICESLDGGVSRQELIWAISRSTTSPLIQAVGEANGPLVARALVTAAEDHLCATETTAS